jgi:hypothetical protein
LSAQLVVDAGNDLFSEPVGRCAWTGKDRASLETRPECKAAEYATALAAGRTEARQCAWAPDSNPAGDAALAIRCGDLCQPIGALVTSFFTTTRAAGKVCSLENTILDFLFGTEHNCLFLLN